MKFQCGIENKNVGVAIGTNVKKKLEYTHKTVQKIKKVIPICYTVA